MHCIAEAWEIHHGELLRFVASRISGPDEAKDVVQEVFLRATRLGKGLCEIDNPRAWLFQVARNLLIDKYRLKREECPMDDDFPDTSGTADTAPVDALAVCLPRVLGELATEDREAITRCDIEGMTQAAYAKGAGLTLVAAKSRVQRARKRLRDQLVSACQVRFDEAGQVCCFVPRPPAEK